MPDPAPPRPLTPAPAAPLPPCSLGLGLPGSALAYVAHEATSVLICLGMMVWLHCKQPEEERTWQGLTSEAFRGWWLYCQVGEGVAGPLYVHVLCGESSRSADSAQG